MTDPRPSTIHRNAVSAAPAAIGGADRARLATEPRRVLVLGAGMAGLTAALALHRRGHDVIVIEGQDRTGGRVRSLPLPNGQVSEAGAGHFRANMPLVLSYVHRFQLPILSLNDGLPRYTLGGLTADAARLGGWPWDRHASERNVSVASTINRYALTAGFNADAVIQPGWPDPATRDLLDPLTLRDLIDRAGGSPAFIDVLGAHGGYFISSGSALGVLPELAYHFGEQAMFRIAGGNDQLPKAMAAELDGRIELGDPVALIDQTGPRVRVVTGSGREYSGDAVICTIPFSVIGEVEVRPSWSERKRAMFAGMAWSTTVKVVIQTREPAWLAQGVHGWPMAGGDRPWERLVDITGNEPGGRGNAFFCLNGPNSAAFRTMPEATRERDLIAMFEADLPGLLGEVVHAETFSWPDQPWIRGSFAYIPPGGGWMIAEWTRPENHIHFAGDFTSLKSGWVEGAIESGLRAARQIDPLARAEAPDYALPAVATPVG
ncbi:MAG: flavin monoamine oxidase family protein [Chloroflexota bacterium]